MRGVHIELPVRSCRSTTYVTIFNTPPGEDPLFVAPSDSSTKSRTLDRSSLSSGRTDVPLGSEVVLSADPAKAIYFAGDAPPSVQPFSSSSYIRSATAQESLEIGALIEFGEDTLVMVLPNNGYFDTFTQREPAAVANYIYQKMTERNPGWVMETVGNRLRKLIMKRLEHYFGQTTQVLRDLQQRRLRMLPAGRCYSKP